MLDSLKKSLLRMLGAAPEPAPAPAPEKTKKNDRKPRNPRPRKESAAAPEKSAAPERPAKSERRPRTPRPPRETADVPERKPAPVKPEALHEVPPVEGKTRFLDLPIHPDVQFGIQEQKFEYCTPIQAMALPCALEGKDIAGKAQTGTGKTAAFLIAIFTRMLNDPPAADRPAGTPRALVLAPTRELAIQIHKDAEALACFTGLKCQVVFGGMDHEKQSRQLSQPLDMLIGTPGRIIDYTCTGALKLGKVEFLVIDEADRMLDMGFIPDVKRIVAHLPHKEKRQTMLFSATLEESILRLAAGWLVSPVRLESEPEKLVSENIKQTFYSVSRDEKLALTLYFIRHMEFDRMLIFGNRKDVNLRLQYDLARYGIEVPILSGDIPQEKRIRILERFRTGEEKIVIATDVAARGIHVDDVSIVLNYDLPERAEDYVHRIGRTGRAGHTGIAISFLCEYGAYNLPAIEELLGVTFPSIQPPEEMLVLPDPLPGMAARRPAPERRGGSHRGGGSRRGGSRPRRR